MLVSIVIPAHNEEENIGPLMKNIRQMLRKSRLMAEVILVDDNSTDSTPQQCDALARGRVQVIHRRARPGMGNALMDGTAAARGDVVVWIMADLTDDLAAIPKFVGEIEAGKDIVFGSRYMRGGSPGDLSRIKAFNSRIVSLLSFIFVGTRVHDITNAFRGFRKDVFFAAMPLAGDFSISPEFALKAHLLGFKLGEVPVTYKNRINGEQKFRMFVMGQKYAIVFLKAVLARIGLADF